MKTEANKLINYLTGAFERHKARSRGFKYLLRNLLATRGMSPLQEIEDQGYYVSGLNADQLPEFDELYALVRNNKPLNYWRKVLLKYRGDVLCIIVMNSDRKIIGFQLHSFLSNEIRQKIIHAEYGGLHPAYRGKGLTKVLRKHIKHTANHFINQGLQGLSGKIHQTNYASQKAANHIGYKSTSEEPSSLNFQNFYLDLNHFNDSI